MTQESRRSLKERWPTVPARKLRDLLLASPCGSEFGRTKEDFCDYRGVEISESLHGVNVDKADFSFGRMSKGQLVGAFSSCKFVNCRYESNVCDKFVDCDFSSSNLTSSVLSGEFVNCTFSETNFNGVRGVKLKFKSCRFMSASFRRAGLYDATFQECKFGDCEFTNGSLAGSKFVDCEFDRIRVADMALVRVTGFVESD